MKQCLECKSDFEPKSELAKFCSDKCRQKKYRKGISSLLAQVRKKPFTEKQIVEIAGNSLKFAKSVPEKRGHKYPLEPKDATENKPYMNETIRKKLGL